MHWETVEDVASQVARNVHKKYHTYFDVSDVRQELIVWTLKREEKINEWLGYEPDSEEYKAGIKMLARALQRHADKYCRKLKAQRIGYELSDEFYYPPSVLDEFLEYAWGEVAPTKKPDAPKVSGSTNPAEGGNFVVTIFDIRKAIAKLEPDDKMILQMKYDEALTFEAIGEALAVSKSSAERKVKGALRRLSNLLGGENPWQRS